jgi:hypothetical protein
MNTVALSSPAEDKSASNFSSWKPLLASISICLGLILAVCGNSYQGDAISYLDMGDHFFGGDRWAIVNGLWSPLFPFVHGLARWLFKPSWRWEPAVVHLTDFLIYITTVFSFQFFWREVLQLYKRAAAPAGQAAFAIFSDGEFWILGYTLFLFMHLRLITSTTPDTLLSTFVYLAAALILRIRQLGATLPRFVLLGLLLALGYLTKAVMLPLAPFFLAGALLTGPPRKRMLSDALVCILTFCAVAGPYVLTLSRKLGHFSTGEAATLNYCYHVNGVDFVYWHGDPPESGTAVHPTRRIWSSPTINEFGTPFHVTYPPWYDPSYWNAGLRPVFRWSGQLAALAPNFEQYLATFWSQSSLIAGVLVLLVMRNSLRTSLAEFFALWYLWLPSLVALLMYGLIWVEARYISQFCVLIWGAALTLVRLPNAPHSRRLLRAVLLVAVILMGGRMVANLARDAIRGHAFAKTQMQIAQGLLAQGLQRGSSIAIIGDPSDEWQKLLAAHVVAEIQYDHATDLQPSNWPKIEDVLRQAGATALVAQLPSWAPTDNWRPIGNTGMYLRFLDR